MTRGTMALVSALLGIILGSTATLDAADPAITSGQAEGLSLVGLFDAAARLGPVGTGASSNEGSEAITVYLPGDIPLELLRIAAGTFTMGSPDSERQRHPGEGPQHEVTLTKGFYLGKVEVTQGQWQAVMGSNPSSLSSCGADCPVENVSWNDIAGAGGFVEKLNQHLSAAGQAGVGSFRLPTEAEWEYAARAGTTTRFSHGDVLECDDVCGSCGPHAQYMWWCGNSGHTLHAVGDRKANPWGLHDVHGGVGEWTADWHGTYPSAAVVDPEGPSSGTSRVNRGGSWRDRSRLSRSAFRSFSTPDLRSQAIGFRLALSR